MIPYLLIASPSANLNSFFIVAPFGRFEQCTSHANQETLRFRVLA